LNRDRFVLSNGHGSMLQYALLHFSGYDLTIDDIKNFRQLHSKTPGHPELHITPGVETTTGPLGQGLANAVGMAIAQKHLAAEFNRPNFPLLDHFIYCFVGDGCLMEGISHEVCSLAGTLKLGKLIVFYDDNGISIDGNLEGWFTDNTPLRFEAYGWHVIPNIDGHDSEAIKNAIIEAQHVTDKPSIICCKTTIGWGSPNLAGTATTHGAALGHEEISATRSNLKWAHEPFVFSKEMYAAWDATQIGMQLEAEWSALLDDYKIQYPELAKEFLRRMQGEFPPDFARITQQLIADLNAKKQSIATRKASQLCLDQLANALPELIGGSADLTESNCTNWKGMQVFSPEKPSGRYIFYGVREFGMSAIMNGIALYKGLIPFGGTFLTFSDYARNAIRLSAIMQTRVIYVYTHDSIGLGEDGPTHQPVEQLPSLRLMPNLSIWRPCDTVETAYAWTAAIQHAGPTCLLLSRQNLAFQEREVVQIENIARGGYILRDYAKNRMPDLILIATGSEVALAVEAATELLQKEIYARIISMPSVDVFLKQDADYQAEVLPKTVKARVVIEAAAGDSWYKFVGLEGAVVSLERFGESAPGKEVFKACGFTATQVVAIAKEVIYSAAEKSDHFHRAAGTGR